MAESKFQPGDRASRSGVYIVTHRSHRLSHLVLMEEGDQFPPCQKCGDDVSFTLHLRVKRIQADRDFQRRAARLLSFKPRMA